MSLLIGSDHSPLSLTRMFLGAKHEIESQTWVTGPPPQPKLPFVVTAPHPGRHKHRDDIWFLNSPTKQEVALRMVSGLRHHDYLGREVVSGEHYNADCWANYGSILIRRTEAEVEALWDEREREEEEYK